MALVISQRQPRLEKTDRICHIHEWQSSRGRLYSEDAIEGRRHRDGATCFFSILRGSIVETDLTDVSPDPDRASPQCLHGTLTSNNMSFCHVKTEKIP